MKYLKYIIAVIAILGIVSSISVRFWATELAMAAEGPSFIRLAPNKSISVLFGNKLFSFANNGQHRSTVDFSDLGLKISGEYAYFSNGDLLFYNFPSKMTFWDSVLSYLRIRSYKNTSDVEGEGFLRCRSSGLDCEPFALDMPALRGHAFGLDIDPLTSNVYVSATEKFEIFKFDEEGNLLARNSTDLRFPNTIRFLDGKLYIADTNHHRVKVVDTSNDNFGEMIDAFPLGGAESNYRWPSVIEYGQNAWWVTLNGSNMALGEILRYSPDWSSYERLELPDGSWPLGMAFSDGILWVADYDQFKIYRYSIDGSRIDDLDSPILNAEYELVEEKKLNTRLFLITVLRDYLFL